MLFVGFMDGSKLVHYYVAKKRNIKVSRNLTIYSWEMQNFDGLFILSHKHKIMSPKFTEAFSNAIRTLSENINFFDQEMVRSGNDRILMQKIEWYKTPVTEMSQWDSDETLPCGFSFRGQGLAVFKIFINCHTPDLCLRYFALSSTWNGLPGTKKWF